MKTLYIALFIISVVLVGGWYYTTTEYEEPDVENELVEKDLRVEFIPEGGIESQEIRVVSEEDEIMFQLTIDELNQWTQENWDVFEEEPEVGGREVDSGGFGFFDRAAAISHDNRSMIFSVSDYAVATTVSFVIVADIKSGEMNMINKPAPGSVEDYFWSEDNNLVAYTLGTARAGGDFLGVDNVVDFERGFILNEEDILEVLDPDQEVVEIGQFMPVFKDLEWSENRLYFATEHLENDRINWSVDREGTDLRIED